MKKTQKTLTQLRVPTIPDKRYFQIGAVSRLLQIKQHVLRYWEQEFPQLIPMRRGSRRYYQRQDLDLIIAIRQLLYGEGYTIKGAREKLCTDKAAEERKIPDPIFGDLVATKDPPPDKSALSVRKEYDRVADRVNAIVDPECIPAHKNPRLKSEVAVFMELEQIRKIRTELEITLKLLV